MDVPTPGAEGRRTFVVEPGHATTAFGPQEGPPGKPAAADADPGEAVDVLGTAHLLAQVEFLARESVRGQLPAGTGVVGSRSAVDHRAAAPVGTEVVVRTRLDRVDGRDLVFDGRLRRCDDDRVVATAEARLQVVDRDRFRATLDGEP